MAAQKPNQTDRPNTAANAVSIAAATLAAIEHIRPACTSKQIEIDMDFDDVSAEADAALIIPAVSGLLANAIAAMPQGGELSVTLVETPSQWELEVADSGPCPNRFQNTTADQTNDQLPTIIEFEAHNELHSVIKLAQRYNGVVQTYPCPLGGSAHVLTVPKIATHQSRRAA